jgi:hypothetical protein
MAMTATAVKYASVIPRRMTRTFWGIKRHGEWQALRKAGYDIGVEVSN